MLHALHMKSSCKAGLVSHIARPTVWVKGLVTFHDQLECWRRCLELINSVYSIVGANIWWFIQHHVTERVMFNCWRSIMGSKLLCWWYMPHSLREDTRTSAKSSVAICSIAKFLQATQLWCLNIVRSLCWCEGKTSHKSTHLITWSMELSRVAIAL